MLRFMTMVVSPLQYSNTGSDISQVRDSYDLIVSINDRAKLRRRPLLNAVDVNRHTLWGTKAVG